MSTPDALRGLYRQVFNTPEGKKILADLQMRCWIDRPTYASQDTHETAFREGQRSVVLSITNMLRQDNRDFPTTAIED